MRRFLALGLAVGLVVLLGACDLLTQLEEDDEIPSLSVLNDLEFDGHREPNSDGGYTTEVVISSTTTSDQINFTLNDSADPDSVEVGTYRLNTSSGAPNTVSEINVVVGFDITTLSVDYLATSSSESAVEARGVTVGTYDQITAGTVTVSKSDNEYTFAWDLELADGDSIRGSYTGTAGGTGITYTDIQVETDYSDQPIAAFELKRFTFTAGLTGNHTISATNLTTDVNWYLYDNRTDADARSLDDIAYGMNTGTAEEVHTVALTAGAQYWLLVEERSGAAGTFDLRVDPPSLGSDTSSPQGLDMLEFYYYGATTDGGFNTDVDILSSSTGDSVYFWLNDDDAAFGIEAGTYTFNVDSEAANILTDVSMFVGEDISMRTYDYAAATVTEAELELDLGDGYTVDVYDQIVSGTVTVSVSGSNYTFEWNLVSADSDTITGSYTGPVDSVSDNS